MTTTAILSSYQHFGTLADYFLFPNSNKAVSTYKKVIEVTTDKKSLKASEQLISELEKKIIPSLPLNKSDVEIDLLQKQLQNIIENQLKINKMFDTIGNLFDNEEDVIIDDDNMIDFLVNMKKVKNILSFINDYLTLAIKVHYADVSIKNSQKTYSAEGIIELLKQCA